MNIFKKIWKSIYGPEFYQDLVNKKTGSSVAYFFKFLLLITIIPTVIISFGFIRDARSFLSESSVSEKLGLFPSELNLKIKDGLFSTNVNEPYIIPLQKPTSSGINNFAVINTKIDAVSFDSFNSYSTALLVTKDSIVAIDGGKLQMVPIAKYFKSEININRSTVSSTANNFLPLLKVLIWFIPLLVYAGLFILKSFYLVAYFFCALIVWLLLIILKKSNGYKHAYRVIIHAMTLPIIISSLLIFRQPWYVTGLLVLIVLLINFIVKNKISHESVSPVSTPDSANMTLGSTETNGNITPEQSEIKQV